MIVSIVTITRNNAAGLLRTIGSVRSQKGVDIEHIIVDGNSTDGTELILRAEAPRAVIVRRNPAGVYDALNAGLAQVRGFITGVLHAGDEFSDPYVLADVLQAFRTEPAPHYIYGDIHYAAPSGRRYSGRHASRISLLHGYAPPHPSLFVASHVQRTVGNYRTDMVTAADFEMFIRLFFDDRLRGKYLNRDMVCMDSHGISGKWMNRIFVNNRERLAALRGNGLKASPLSLLKRYIYLFRQ